MPAAGLSPAQQATWGPQGALAQPTKLTAAPQQQGAAEAQGPNPDDAALAALVAPRGGGAPRTAGLSPADKQYAAALTQSAQDLGGSIDGAVQQNQDAVKAFADHSAAVRAESEAGAASYMQQMQANQQAQEKLATDADQEWKAAQSRLAKLQGQGIDPNHYWQSRSTGEKIMSGIAVALGQMGTALTHGQMKNVPLEMIQDAVRDDLAAQRTNLEKSIEVAKMGGQSAQEKFSLQSALLRAQRESLQSAYAVVDQNIGRQMGLNSQNAQFQQNAAQFRLQVEQARQHDTMVINKDLYALQKGAERVVGGGEDLGAKVRALTEKIYLDSKGEVSIEEARRKAVELAASTPNLKPGAPQTAWGPGAKGAQPSAKEREEASAMQDALADIAEMKRLRQAHNGGTLSPEERTRAEAFAAAASERRLAGIGRVNKQLLQKVNKIIPENPLELNAVGIVGSDPTMAKLNAAEEIIRGELGRRGSGGGPEANANPADLEEEKEE